MQLLSLLKELSLHPKNAEELKGLILQLAVEGKLTSNWRADNSSIEPAGVLLTKIEKEKVQLLKEKKIPKSKRLTEIEEDEKYFIIPESWVWDRLGNIGNIFNGDSVNKDVKEVKYAGLKEGYPYIATKDVGYGFEKINQNNGVRIPFDEPKFKVAKKGTVIICSEGGSAGKKMGMLTEDCCFGNKLYAIEQFGGIESVYILGLYGSPAFRAAFQEKMSGIIGGISRSNFIDLLIPIPPLDEQKAIVEVVNQLFAEVEQLEELTKERISLKEDFVTSALRKLTETGNTTQEWSFLQQHFSNFFTEKPNIKKLRETILQLAVQGKLTAQWREENPSVEHASELLKRIEAEKQQLIAEKKIKAEKMITQFEDKEIPFTIPSTWTWCRMQDVCPNITSGSTPPKPFFKEEGIPYLKVYNIRNQKIDFSYREQFIDNDYHSSKLKRSILEPGDVIMNIVGPPLGKVAIIPDDYKEWNCNQAISLFRPLDRDLSTWLYTFLCAGSFLQHIELIGTAGQDNISVTKSKTIMLPLPPKEEQQAIV